MAARIVAAYLVNQVRVVDREDCINGGGTRIIQDRISISHDALTTICQRFRVRELAVYGSIVRDDFRDDSNVDVLVDFEPGAAIGLFEFADLQHALADLFQRDVDLVSKRALHPFNRDEVLADCRPIWPEAPEFELAPARQIRRERMQLAVMLEAVDGIVEIVAGAHGEPSSESGMTIAAIAYELIRIGVLAERISVDLKRKYACVDWDLWIERGEKFRIGLKQATSEELWEIAALKIPVLRQQIVNIRDLEADIESSDETD